ncbi:hypothetical protein [Rhodococcus sp. RDE2]|uniref:hypothetical protein n=1 Tax=Rhodococcus sp. RDE2 TaxID=2885078 RepID=UPI001E3CA139|nr:hypothetical protein [Rhodococcus sp. RDE2]
MWYPVTCANCGKTGWGGCGQHVDAVMASVPVADRCTCHRETGPAHVERRSVRALFRR